MVSAFWSIFYGATGEGGERPDGGSGACKLTVWGAVS
jgi:hypothetical protein